MNIDQVLEQPFDQRLADHDTLENMQRHGGHWVRCLAELALASDPAYYLRLRDAFPEIWERYAKFPAK